MQSLVDTYATILKENLSLPTCFGGLAIPIFMNEPK